MPDPLQNGLISRTAELERLVETLVRQPVIAVDTESNSLFAYREQVCLVQFSTLEADYLVDPLILMELSALGPIFADGGIEKVFHAAEYDILCLKRDFDFQFRNLFDTMQAARILGRKAVGLGSLVEEEFGVQLDKRGQRANWGQRPLQDSLIFYARQDTHYLIALRDLLAAELVERGLWDLAQEDFRRLCAVNAPLPEGDRDLIWRISGVHELSSQQTAILQELSTFRAQMARTMDRPLFKVMGDKTLVSVAVAAPRRMEELRGLPGMTEGQVRRYGRGIIRAVRRGLVAEPLKAPPVVRPDNGTLARLEALKEWRKATGKKLGFESDVVLPRDVMVALAEENPRGREALGVVMADVPWRLERFGEDVLRVLGGR
ncbi:MAG: HRDC domain-containing protein [Anaerolineales bacterium]|nr:HRDC domain-containing protein [Anaerolineales bacterium]